MPQVFLAAEGVARMVVQGVRYTETGLPRLFETSEQRLERERQKKRTRNGEDGLEAKL
jgi:hypothetical protein